jgi:hypothetical protein
LANDYTDLRGEVTALEGGGSFSPPKDEDLQIFTKQLSHSESLIVTESEVTEGSMAAAAIQPRCKSESQVMSGINASEVSVFKLSRQSPDSHLFV